MTLPQVLVDDAAFLPADETCELLNDDVMIYTLLKPDPVTPTQQFPFVACCAISAALHVPPAPQVTTGAVTVTVTVFVPLLPPLFVHVRVNDVEDVSDTP